MTGAAQGASPAEEQPPAGERIVIKNKRKISPSGATMSEQPATPAAPAAGTEQPSAVQETPAPESTEQNPTPDVTDQAVGEQDTVEVSAVPQPTEAPAEAGPDEEAVEGEVVEDEPVVTAAPEAEAAPAALGAELAQLRSALEERTADLQRVTAEYANYRKRVERDRTVSAELATGQVLSALLPVLDDLDRAREHGDLSGPFGAVADQIGAVVAKFGLTAFGEKGDAFDPNRHEAVAHLPSADVTEPTCIDVMRRGYLLGERLLRPAMVAVAAPE
ncbi:nucleotide exchange factor GrpE [Catellatospora sichuanensis]|uniref:nucleotide exchange factor GrpE n=1 Tax=Catellatospora sichuanensis TaxID=1969805 RepID=UPI001FEB97B1|nr:nucleotide exchange factor GrpE [Catellatospora sichuanensis]